MTNILWKNNPELLERIVRLRANGNEFGQCGQIVGLTECNVHYVYHTELAKRLCRKLGLPHFKRRSHPLNKPPKHSAEEIETFVRLHFVEKRSWNEVAEITGLGWAGIRMQCYSKRGKEIRERLGVYRPKNVRHDFRGKRFGRLKVIRCAGLNKHKNILWRCKCSCGALVITSGTNLAQGHSRTCGSGLHRQGKNSPRFKHGGTTPKMRTTWNSYNAMLRRCFATGDESYAYYGGRGITVCNHWRASFLNFLASMGKRPKNKTLDRIYPHGHYSCGRCEQCVSNRWPGNVRWATDEVQANNKQRDYPPLSEEEKARLLRSSDPYSEEVVF